MLKKSTCTFILVSFLTGLNAQLYKTGFDNTGEKAGWQEFRKGVSTSFNWSYASAGAYSAPNCLTHDYPVGSSSSDTTIDWFVSPKIPVTGGGKVDSIRINVYSITGSKTLNDFIGLYMLVGSSDPALASNRVLLADLTGMVSSGTAWKDTGNFAIPALGNITYLGILYRATNNWFQIKIDDIKISAVNSVKVLDKSLDFVNLFPNPASEVLNIKVLPNAVSESYRIRLFNNQGRLILESLFEKNCIIPLNLPSGLYFYQINSTKFANNQIITSANQQTGILNISN